MQNKTLISLIIGASLIFCALLLTRKTSVKAVTIQFASWGSESEISILKPLLQDFEKENPDIKIDFMHIPQNYFQKIHLLFASNSAPDVIFMNNQYLPIYANAGVLEDLSYTDFDYKSFYPKSVKALSWKNKIYGIPRDISNLVIFYNKDIFDKYKVPYPKSDWTLNEFLHLTQKLTHLPDVYGISFEEEPLFFLPYLTAYGGWNSYDTENYFKQNVLEREPNSKGLKFYSDLRKQYHTAPYKNEIASTTMAQMFLQGKLAMHLSGRWLVPKYRSEAKFDWDVIEFPSTEKSRKSTVPMDASGWVISKSSKHKTESVKLIKFLSSTESSRKFTQSGLIVPAKIEVANSNVFLDNHLPKNAKAFLTTAQNSIPTPVTLNYREILDSLKSKTEYMFNE